MRGVGWVGLGHSLTIIKWTWRFFPQNLQFSLPPPPPLLQLGTEEYNGNKKKLLLMSNVALLHGCVKSNNISILIEFYPTLHFYVLQIDASMFQKYH